MKNENQSYLGTRSIGKLMMKYAVPCIISLLIGALYNIVDQIFIANASYLGSYGNAANTVVFPLTMIALAIAVMIGDGCCAFISISLGRNEKENAHRSVGNSIIICVFSSLFLTIIYVLFKEPILILFGGQVNAETYALAKEYFFWITLGIPFYMFGQAMNPIIRSDGSPRYAMMATVTGAIVNIIFDPIFIFIFRWGMMGDAVATILGQVATAILSICYLCHMKIVKINQSSFKLNGVIIRKFLTLGITSFLAEIALVISMAAVQNTCMKYGALDSIFGQEEYAQIPLAVLGIVMKFFQITVSISIGIAAGCIPIAGYNIGANNINRIKKLFTYLLLAEVIVGGVALIIVECFPLQIANLFGAANESGYYTTFVIKCFRIYLCMMIIATVNKGTFIFLQSLGKAISSTIVSLTREIILGVLLPIIMPIFMGLDGLLWSFPVADILTFIVALFFIIKTYQELNRDLLYSIN